MPRVYLIYHIDLIEVLLTRLILDNYVRVFVIFLYT